MEIVKIITDGQESVGVFLVGGGGMDGRKTEDF